MATLLVALAEERTRRREAMRTGMLARLRTGLAELLPRGSRVWIFGSVLRPDRFREDSDIDLAVEKLPPGRSEFWLQGELELRLGRAVEILILGETRLRSKIEREGEPWTL